MATLMSAVVVLLIVCTCGNAHSTYRDYYYYSDYDTMKWVSASAMIRSSLSTKYTSLSHTCRFAYRVSRK